MAPKPWKLIQSRTERRFPIFNLRIDRACSPRTAIEHDFYVLEAADWVNVIPLTSGGEVVLVRQYRHGLRDLCLEIPGGIVEAVDSPQEAAHRELLEETGYQAAEMLFLDYVYPNPAFLNNRCHTFLCRDVTLKGGQEQDEKEDIEVILKPLKEIPTLIREGHIRHSLVVAAFYRYFIGCYSTDRDLFRIEP